MADHSLHKTFRASTRILLREPKAMIERLCEHFAEHGSVTRVANATVIDAGFGAARLEARGRDLAIDAEGTDETSLAYVKMSVAEHILAFARPDVPHIVWQGDVRAGLPLPYFREMRVSGIANVTPHMRRLTLAGNDLARFAVNGLHIRLLFPPAGSETPVWPVMGEDGRPAWPEDDERPAARVYTIRRIDVTKSEIDVDFVLHEGSFMPGARFAAQARIGDVVGMTGPGGGAVGAADWYLLVGDETALPAIARILETLPATAHAVVRIGIADEGEKQALHSLARTDIVWLPRNGVPAGTTSLLEDAVRAVEWPAPGARIFAWAGCEYAAFKTIRAYLRKERQLAREEHLVVAYWRRGAEGDAARAES